MGDLVTVDYSPEIGKLVFAKESGGALVPGEPADPNGLFGQHTQSSSNAIAIATPEAGPAPARAKE
jgi:hypothetical protein